MSNLLSLCLWYEKQLLVNDDWTLENRPDGYSPKDLIWARFDAGDYHVM